MMETNIRLTSHGANIYLDTRILIVEGQQVSHELLQRLCTILQKRYRVAAVPYRNARSWNLLALTREPVEPLAEQGENWHIEGRDTGESRRLQFSTPQHQDTMALLLERSFLVEIRRRTDLWTLDSPRIWYESTPFKHLNDICAYRRHNVSVIPIDLVGLGLVVHVETAFFTTLTVSDYLQNGNPGSDRDGLHERFDFLTRRQQGQKGTLLYDLGASKHKCYFEEFLHGVTCDTTGPMRVQGQTYSSLFEYYQERHPEASVRAKDPVAKVSFPGLDRPQCVAANKLRLRLMNEALPQQLKQVDKISPDERSKLINGFLAKLAPKPFGKGQPGIMETFWQPSKDRAFCVRPPALLFGQGKELPPPAAESIEAYSDYYKQRLRLLNEAGCFYVPPAVERIIHFSVPDKGPEEMTSRFSYEMIRLLSRWTKKNIQAEVDRYSTVGEAVSTLRSKAQTGMVVFTFEDEDPSTYFNLAYDLKSWRIKRVTYHELEARFSALISTERRSIPNAPRAREIRDWHSFIEMNALDVVQQLNCVPWSLVTPLDYEAMMVIDVGEDRRHFALSLLICRSRNAQPSFWLDTIVYQKIDHKNETINEIVLRDAVTDLVKRANSKNFSPITALLILRDGRECGREIEAIRDSQIALQEVGLFSPNIVVDIVDFHKRSLKGIRLWEHNGLRRVNVLEGTSLIPDKKTAVLANTGAATLNQGTSDPLILVATSEGVDMVRATRFVHSAAQLNWSSPRVAQRFPLPLKRTDDDLRNRSAQEIKRYR